jgi:sugar/nucleoside kinase (ribokinase family)
MMEKVLCIGTLIIDIINDAIDRPFNPGEGVSTTIGVHLGGNAYNVAVDLAKLGLSKGQVSCVGAVGDDHFGELFQRELPQYGVVPRVQIVGGSQTSKNVILQIKAVNYIARRAGDGRVIPTGSTRSAAQSISSVRREPFRPTCRRGPVFSSKRANAR